MISDFFVLCLYFVSVGGVWCGVGVLVGGWGFDWKGCCYLVIGVDCWFGCCVCV